MRVKFRVRVIVRVRVKVRARASDTVRVRDRGVKGVWWTKESERRKGCGHMTPIIPFTFSCSLLSVEGGLTSYIWGRIVFQKEEGCEPAYRKGEGGGDGPA